MGRPAQAHALLVEALAQQPDSAELQALTAQSLIEDGHPRSAILHAERACALAPDRAWHHRLRALSHEALDRPHEALKAAKEAVRLDPRDWNNHAIFSRLAADAVSNAPIAREAAARAVELAPWAADAHFAVGYAAQRAGKRRVARAAYRRVLEIEPDHPAAHNNLGVLTRLGPAASAPWHLRALRADPQDQIARRNLALHPQQMWLLTLLVGVGCTVVGVLLTPDHPALTRAIGGVTGGALVVYTWLAVRRLPRQVLRLLLSNSAWMAGRGSGGVFVVLVAALGETLCFIPSAARACAEVSGRLFSGVNPALPVGIFVARVVYGLSKGSGRPDGR